MTDRPTNESGTGSSEQAAGLLRSARERLEPMLAGALDALARDAGAPGAQTDGTRTMSSGSFFAVAEFLNDLLAGCEAIALTMTAGGDRAH